MLNSDLTSSPKRLIIEPIDALGTFQSDLVFIKLTPTDKTESGLPSHSGRLNSRVLLLYLKLHQNITRISSRLELRKYH